MKKFTVTMIALLSIMVAFAAGPKRQISPQLFAPVKGNVQLGQQLNAKQAPAQLAKKAVKANVAKARGIKKAATAADLAGDYTWDYEWVSEFTTQLDTMTTTAGSTRIKIAEAEDGNVTISGMGYFDDLTASIESDEDGDWLVIAQQTCYTDSNYGTCSIKGVFYYEGDEEYAAGWYFSNAIYGFIAEDGVITLGNYFINMYIDAGTYAGYSLLMNYYAPYSTFTPADPLMLVTPPEGVAIDAYVMVYLNSDSTTSTAPVNVAVDGTDVYFQGISYYLPEAWVKGTKDADNNVAFPAMQYVGEYGSYGSSYAFYGEDDVIFVYDEAADTYTAEGEIYGVLADRYYDGYYLDPVLKRVVEKAGMPADPAITALTKGNYGWYIDFEIPLIDVDGDPLAAEKLSYQLFTDTEREVSELTFTPATHEKLTEDMTVIPYGFTENYDFYSSEIYLNDLYSSSWNKIGIKSIYNGGGETNETEIQWYNIKDYSSPMASATFNFNEMDVAVSSNDSHAGDITADTTLVADNGSDIELTISPAREDGKTPTRYWGTANGPQLRCYYNTLTIEAPENFNVTSIVFNHTGYWGGKDGGDGTKVTADSGELTNDKTMKAATWTGEAQSVVITIDANTQINSITVTCKGIEAEEEAIDPEGITYTFDEDMEGWTSIDADDDGYGWEYLESSESIPARNDSKGAVLSRSYISSVGALTPDNYLVSPKVKLGSTFSFFAVAQDASYPAEHFGVFVSTTSKKVEEFAAVEEWTLTAARAKVAPRKVQGNWYQYIVDMSAFEGEEGYVAIRHFDCTDNFYMIVDDITFGTPEEYTVPVKPDLVELPEGVETEEWTLCALDEDGDIDLPVQIGIDGTDMYIQGLGLDYMPDAWVKGTIEGETVTFPAGQFMGTYSSYYGNYDFYFGAYGEGEDEEAFLKDVVFTYDAENGRMVTDDYIILNSDSVEFDPLVAYYMVEILREFNCDFIAPIVPEGLETAEYLLTAIHEVTNEDEEGNETSDYEEFSYNVQIGFDGNDVYFIGLSEDFTEAVAKGTLSEDGTTITIPANQFMGTYDVGGYGYYFYSYYITSVAFNEDGSYEMADVVFNYDAKAGKLTITPDQMFILNDSHKTINNPYDVLYEVELTLVREEVKGDVNGDGEVGIGDIVAITNVMAGIFTDMTEEEIEALKARADVNGDGEVGIGDIVAITNIMAGIVTEPVEEPVEEPTNE